MLFILAMYKGFVGRKSEQSKKVIILLPPQLAASCYPTNMFSQTSAPCYRFFFFFFWNLKFNPEPRRHFLRQHADWLVSRIWRWSIARSTVIWGPRGPPPEASCSTLERLRFGCALSAAAAAATVAVEPSFSFLRSVCVPSLDAGHLFPSCLEGVSWGLTSIHWEAGFRSPGHGSWWVRRCRILFITVCQSWLRGVLGTRGSVVWCWLVGHAQYCTLSVAVGDGLLVAVHILAIICAVRPVGLTQLPIDISIAVLVAKFVQSGVEVIHVHVDFAWECELERL